MDGMENFVSELIPGGATSASMPQKPLTRLPRAFWMWLSCSKPNSSACFLSGHAHRPRGARLVGVVAAPQAIDTVQRGGRDGAVGLQVDVALGAEEEQHIVGLAARMSSRFAFVCELSVKRKLLLCKRCRPSRHQRNIPSISPQSLSARKGSSARSSGFFFTDKMSWRR